MMSKNTFDPAHKSETMPPYHTAIVVDDLAVDRQLTVYALEKAGWKVHTARHTLEGMSHVQRLLAGPQVSHTLILTDLHMPGDPAYRELANRQATAGASFALYVRGRMERGELTRVPIVALTAMNEYEVHMTALAFGCDAVLHKPATPDLADRIMEALRRAQANPEVVGAEPLLRLLRTQLIGALARERPGAPTITERDLTRGLFAYRRQGLVGLGNSSLALALAPHLSSAVQRGEYTYTALHQHLETIKRLGAEESLTILQGELLNLSSPDEVRRGLGISRSEYYRRRNEAMAVLLDLLTQSP